MYSTWSPPAGAVPGFTLVEMDSPEGIPSAAPFNVEVRFSGNPGYALWPFVRDLPGATYKIDLFAETIGPGPEVSLNGPGGAVGALVAGQDAYTVPIAVAGALAAKRLYELGCVITFYNGAALVGGFAAYVGDALVLVY